jgi:hypothetical protein
MYFIIKLSYSQENNFNEIKYDSKLKITQQNTLENGGILKKTNRIFLNTNSIHFSNDKY